MRDRYRLGIDTGGTFTDAVLLDAARQVVASAKCLTTRFDLAQGIGEALGRLPAALLAQVELVGLSTTLTTNSVIEGRGAPVCVLLAGYDAAQIAASGLAGLVGKEAIVALEGGHDAGGAALAPIDEVLARAAITRHMHRVSAFAISACFGVRNPAHELQLRALVQALCDKPVTCGHELASSLGAPRRALTAALNARMVSHVAQLVAAVRATLAQHAIDAPLMLVQGDGALVDVAHALRRPIHTVLCGPAASVLGACALSGHADAIVADMGGTTTDIAVVRGGRPALGFEGALLGQWRPMVEAIRVYAIGLGGDSEVRFGGGEGLVIGPRRVLPVSLLAHQHPWVLQVLEQQQRGAPHASQLRFAQRLNAEPVLIAGLPADEHDAWQRLQQGPIDLERANATERTLSKAIARLERKGLAIYSGFTPSDAAHVLGLSSHWSRAAAVCGARIWARQMRYLYGLGTWSDGDAQAPARDVLARVQAMISHRLVEAGLNDSGQMSEADAGRVAGLLTTLALSGAQASDAGGADRQARRDGAGAPQPGACPVFGLRFAPDLPLVAVGAPAAVHYPQVARDLGLQLVVPPHAEVANAVGAVLGQVVQRVHLLVAQPQRGVFRVFAPSGPRDFDALAPALALAQQLAGAEAQQRALHAGAAAVQVVLSRQDNQVDNDIDGHMFFEACITATASGPPRTRGDLPAQGAPPTAHAGLAQLA